MKKTTIRLGNRDVPALEISIDLLREITGRAIMPSYGYLGNQHTICVARSPDNENPSFVCLVKRMPNITTQTVQRDGYRASGYLDERATIIRRLREV